MDAIAPAKAILSGEHSVVYGAPALAVAVKRYAHCRLFPATALRLQLDDLNIDRRLSSADLSDNHARCRSRHRAYLDGQLTVDQVLSQEGDLLLFALVELLGHRDLERLEQLDIRIGSQIPVGAGMGSSAAIVAALLRGVANHLSLDLSSDELVQLTHRAEQLQHGRSSGIDPAICCRGGSLRFCQGEIMPLSLSLGGRWSLADTGRPVTGTGLCVEQVRRHFTHSAIWSEFSGVTESLEHALARQKSVDIVASIRHNHRLLCDIGVVPQAVQDWIASIETAGGAAKISGAGAVAGDSAGLVLIHHPDPAFKLPATDYNLIPMEVDDDGARVRD